LHHRLPGKFRARLCIFIVSHDWSSFFKKVTCHPRSAQQPQMTTRYAHSFHIRSTCCPRFSHTPYPPRNCIVTQNHDSTHRRNQQQCVAFSLPTIWFEPARLSKPLAIGLASFFGGATWHRSNPNQSRTDSTKMAIRPYANKYALGEAPRLHVYQNGQNDKS